jgi:hypothetical protein
MASLPSLPAATASNISSGLAALLKANGVNAGWDLQVVGFMPISQPDPIPTPPVQPAQQVSGWTDPALPAPAALPACTLLVTAGVTGIIAANLTSGTCLQFECGRTYNVSSITMANNTKVTSVGTGPKPILIGTSGVNMFVFPVGVQRVYVGDVLVTSPWVPAIESGTTCPYQLSNTMFGNVRGSDVTLASIDIGTLLEGPNLIGAQRVNLSFVKQLNARTVFRQVVYISGCIDLTETDCVYLDSVDESSHRITSTGAAPDDGCRRYLAERCYFGMKIDPSHGRSTVKAAFTGRSGTDWTIRDCDDSGGDFSIQLDQSGKQTIDRVLVDDMNIAGARLFFAEGLSNALARNLNINNQTGSECICDQTAAGANISYTNITATGTRAGLLKVNGNGNPTLTGYKWTPSVAGAPVLNPNSNGRPVILP